MRWISAVCHYCHKTDFKANLLKVDAGTARFPNGTVTMLVHMHRACRARYFGQRSEGCWDQQCPNCGRQFGQIAPKEIDDDKD